jgi:hypothetical protein
MRAPGRCLQQRQEPGGEQEVAEVVGAERQLEAVLGEAARAGQARVVDQHVDRLALADQRVGARPHGGEVAEVERDEAEPIVAGGAGQLVEHGPGLGLAARGDGEARAAGGQGPRGLLADAGVGAGDDDVAVGELGGGHGRQRGRSHAVRQPRPPRNRTRSVAKRDCCDRATGHGD